jgi:pimeloyl-ACP methyl ester carboxylesterase
MMSYREQPVAFGRARHLIGVVCRPHGTPRQGSTVAIFLNSGIIHRVGPHRLYVRIARAFAEVGGTSLRFDLSGIGDSTAPAGETGSVMDTVRRDIADAIAYAGEQLQSPAVVLVGLCSGADNALETALRDVRVAEVVLIDPNVHRTRMHVVHHYRKRLLMARTWTMLMRGEHPRLRRLLGVSAPARRHNAKGPSLFLAPTVLPERSAMLRDLEALLQRGTKMCYIFSGGLDRYNHAGQLFSAYPCLRRAEAVRMEYLPRADHTFSAPDVQDHVVSSVVTWLAAR